MSKDKQNGIYCCVPPTPGLRMLTFPDGSKAGVMGLGEILEALYEEGKEVGPETAEEIVKRLSVKNYIAASSRDQYREVLLGEYRKYAGGRANEGRGEHSASGSCGDNRQRKGFFSKLLKG